MGKICVKEYYEMDNEDCIINGYMILNQGIKYYVRLAGFPLMVLLEFDDFKTVHSWIDRQDNKELVGKNTEIDAIRKYQRRYGVW